MDSINHIGNKRKAQEDLEHSKSQSPQGSSEVTKKIKRVCCESIQAEGFCLETSPDEIKMAIFSYLNPKDLSSVSMVSKQFATIANDTQLPMKACRAKNILENAFRQEFKSLGSEKFKEKYSDELSIVESLEFSNNISLPSNQWFEVTVDMMKFFNEFCPEIKELKLPFKTQNESLKFLPKNLTSLKLSNSMITDAELPHIASLKKLRSLFLRSDEITDEGLSQFAPLNQLSSLTLYSCGKITDKGLRHLSSLAERPLHLWRG